MNLTDLLEHAYLVGGFTTRSDIARTNAELVAEASFLGFITTDTPRDGFGCVWRLTPFGIDTLYDAFALLASQYVTEDPLVRWERNFWDTEGTA